MGVTMTRSSGRHGQAAVPSGTDRTPWPGCAQFPSPPQPRAPKLSQSDPCAEEQLLNPTCCLPAEPPGAMEAWWPPEDGARGSCWCPRASTGETGVTPGAVTPMLVALALQSPQALPGSQGGRGEEGMCYSTPGLFPLPFDEVSDELLWGFFGLSPPLQGISALPWLQGAFHSLFAA